MVVQLPKKPCILNRVYVIIEVFTMDGIAMNHTVNKQALVR